MRELLANLISAAHVGIAAFVLFGLLAICLGKVFEWKWTENKPFRWTHFAVIGFITFRALFGFACPISLVEDSVRGRSEVGLTARFAFRGTEPRMFMLGAGAIFLSTLLLAWHSHLEKRKRNP